MFKQRFWYRWLMATLLGGLLLLTGNVVAQTATAFSGQATVVRANVLGESIVLADTGPLPSSGGAEEASLLSESVPGLLTVEILHATTIGQGDRSRSEASVANLDLTVGNNTIMASFLMSRAEAVCTAGGPQANGQSEIADLVINGQEIAVTGTPNQTILLPDGKVVINEQSSTRPGDITVNALHVTVDGVADVVIASAHADVTCGQSNCQTPKDFVTGGGWIVTPSGAKGNFAVAGGLKNGAFWGHLQYIDHGTGMKVKGTAVTAYMVTGPRTRHIKGTCDIDGQPGTYDVDVTDNGEPGRDDVFQITLSSGYTAGGNLGGGNIKIHKPCQ